LLLQVHFIEPYMKYFLRKSQLFSEIPRPFKS